MFTRGFHLKISISSSKSQIGTGERYATNKSCGSSNILFQQVKHRMSSMLAFVF